MPRLPTLGFLCSALSLVACRSEGVVRIFDGREVSGEFVSPESYAAFADAALEEAQGHRDTAVAAYERALAEDPGNAVAWGRIGALRCTSDPAAAAAAFARAERLAPELASPWLARAACDLERRDGRAATAHALRAAALAPNDDEATRLVALAFESAGDKLAAERWRRGLLLRDDRAAKQPAEGALGQALDGADSERAERAAIVAHVGDSELSLRAVQKGRVDLAATIAVRVLDADPASSDARIAALVSADFEGDGDSFERWCAGTPKGSLLPTPLGAELLEGLIARRVGSGAAHRWSAAYRAVLGR
jgi:tetratricopeptide (TPR) repeat protein